jgi:hypothetical protein
MQEGGDNKMSLTRADWMVYVMLAIFGLMIIDFLIALGRRFWEGNFKPDFALEYLKDILYYILPLNILISLMGIDPTDWVLLIFYFVGGFFVILKYVLDIINKFRKSD